MNGGAPPTLLDRLTRLDREREPSSAGDSKARSEPLPLLDDLLDAPLRDSGRSQAMGRGGFEETRATDFAITTVNVPDRLDMREVRDQAEEEYKRPGLFSFDRYLLGLWTRRIVVVSVLAALVFWGFETLRPIQQDLSASSIAERLSRSAGFPVRVADTAFRVTPSPRFVMSGVGIGDVTFDEVAIRINWQDAWGAVRGGSWSWGEAVVAPVKLTASQAWALIDRGDGLARALPTSLSVVRLPSVTIADASVPVPAVEVVLRRAAGGAFGPVAVGPAAESTSSFRLSLTPGTSADGRKRVAFQFDANDWTPPTGSGMRWGEVVANGFVSPSLLEVESYSLAGSYGVMQGAYFLATDQYWVSTGFARGTGIDVEAVVSALARGGAAAPRVAGEEAVRAPFSGTATLTLALGGQGESAGDAVKGMVLAGPVQVRWAAINGINLGYAATHGGSGRGLGGGFTRFSELDATLLSAPDGITLRDIEARAGAMLTRGQVRIDADRTLSGAIRVDLGATRVQAPINLRVRGTLATPQFAR